MFLFANKAGPYNNNVKRTIPKKIITLAAGKIK